MGCNSTEMEDIGELERVKLRIRALEAKLTLTPEEMTLLASYILKENRLAEAVPVRGRLSGIALEDSAFYGIDASDERPRARFTIINTRPTPPTQIQIYALIDTGAESDLVIPMATARELGLVPTGQVKLSKGSTNTTAKKVMFEPVKLVATFLRGDTEDERFAFLDVSAFEELPIAEQAFGNAVATDIKLDSGSESLKGLLSASKRRRVDSDSSGEGRSRIITSVGLVEHRPPASPNQRVILGAKALKKLDFHVNVSGRCLEIEEERIVEDD